MSIIHRESMEEIDANLIHGDLWMGSAPPRGRILEHLGFTLVVLCSTEYQPPASKFPGVKVLHAPFEDDRRNYPSRKTLQGVLETAEKVYHHIQSGKGPVLVSCFAGLNRSGLVSGLAVRKLAKISGKEAVDLIRFMRPGSLFNEHFVTALSQVSRPI